MSPHKARKEGQRLPVVSCEFASMCGLELFLILLLLLLLVLLIALILMAIYGFPNHARGAAKLTNLPPGKLSRLPLIGEALSFFKPHYSPFVGDFLDQRMHRYGSIFRMNIFGESTVVSLDKEFNKFVLQKERTGFAMTFPKSMLDVLGTASVGQTGALHLMLRSFLEKALKGNNLRTHLLPAMDREASLLLDSWRSSSTSSLSVVKECKKFTFNLTMKYVINMCIEDEELSKLRAEYDTFIQGFFTFPLNIPGTSYRRALQSRSVILNVFKRKLEELSNYKDDYVREGFASKLVEANLTMDQILDTLLGVGFAGYKTTSSALSLAIYFLQSCPNAIQQLKEEHMAIVDAKRKKHGDRTLTWLDYKDMEFTQSVINETLRLGNVATLSFRRTTRDVSYKGFDIPSGWMVIVIMSAAHRDASNFEDPLAFNPWRWKARSTTTSDENMMPFGYGPRLCLGSDLSKVGMAIFLHHLVRRYDLEAAEEDKPMFFPYVHFPKGFPVKVFPHHK